MGDYHTYYERKPGETTQWEDQLIKHGIIEKPEPAWKPDAYTPEEEVDRNSKAFVDSASARELEEIEYDDDRFMEEYRYVPITLFVIYRVCYWVSLPAPPGCTCLSNCVTNSKLLFTSHTHTYIRRKRLEQIQAESAKKEQCTVPRITRDQFVEKVTMQSQHGWIVVNLVKDHIVACMVMQDSIKQLAKRFPRTKFVEVRKLVMSASHIVYPANNEILSLRFPSLPHSHRLCPRTAFLTTRTQIYLHSSYTIRESVSRL